MGYLKTMDGMVQFIVDSANNVNKIQIMILAMEGVVLSLVAVAYIWFLSSQVGGSGSTGGLLLCVCVGGGGGGGGGGR